MSYDNTNSGIISKNDRKEKDTHPDINGSINVEGVDYWINGWLKKSQKDGRPFYSLSVKRKEERAKEIRDQYEGRRDQKPLDAEAAVRKEVGMIFGGDMDDEIPFAPEWR